MAQYHNNKEKNIKSWSKIIIFSCQNEIIHKSLKWTTLMYIYILPVLHCSILAKSFLRRLKNNNIFTLQLSNPDSCLPSDSTYESYSNFKNNYFYMKDIALYLEANRLWDDREVNLCVNFQMRLHDVSNVSITSKNL